MTKICVACGLRKSTAKFYRNRQSKDGLTSRCRPCSYQKILPLKTKKWLEDGAKECNKCGIKKKLGQFGSVPTGLLGLSSWCKSCVAERARQVHEKSLSPKDKNRIKEWRWRLKKIKAGLCITCGQNRADGKKRRCLECLERRAKTDSERIVIWRRAGKCTGCGSARDRQGNKCDKCFEKDRYRTKQKGFNRRLRFIEAYGGKCECCGETNPFFLTADHINRDGKGDRKKGRGIYQDCLKRKRVDIRVLCFNCNCAREINDGVCPHKM